MAPSRSLRTRIVLAYLLLAALLCGLFGAITYVSVQTIEEVLIRAKLADSGDRMIEDYLRGAPVKPDDPEVLTGDRMPPWLQHAEPGVHEVSLHGQTYHVLVRDHEGRRFAVVHDDSAFEQIETYVAIAFAAACAVCLLAAFLFGSATASRVIRPVTELADAVREDRLAGLAALDSVDELGVLARTFAARSDEMQRFLLREQFFTGDVSHELRTPLTVILGGAELLQARLADRPDLLPAVERIRRTAVETAQRVSALLLLSRSPADIEAPRVEFASIVEQEIERCRPLLRDKPVRLVFTQSATPFVQGPPELIGIAVDNLLRNACRFTEEGEVRITLEEGRLVVEDTGPGLPTELREKIFERFVRAAPEAVPGTGLGLAIVQRVCEHLGWTVGAGSSPSGGSRFVLAFPDAFPDAFTRP
ncbi:MAG TPA: HAMP domain-containing sensor histidine kinase [Ramlibacter sp.]|uniref:sensor histidine kinase n=1 Tax=Ramlibacter sp. TaxID=1917967 RepID=UPI002ED69AF5